MRRAVVLIALAGAAFPAAADAAPRTVRGARADLGSAQAPRSQLRKVDAVRSGRRLVRRYRQVVGGLPVLGGDAVLTEGAGTGGDLLVDGSRRIRRPPRATLSRTRAVRTAVGPRLIRGRPSAKLSILPRKGGARVVWRVGYRVARVPSVMEVLVDARTGRVLRRRDLVRHAAQEARVFDTNAVVANGSVGTLADASPDADFEPLYDIVGLQRLANTQECLEGDYAVVFFDDPVQPECRVNGDFTTITNPDPPNDDIPMTRSFGEFEAAMAYFHTDRAQDYIQGLGVLNANNRQTRIDVNAFAADNSFYMPDPGGNGTGSIAFGDGGVDDAEDGDVIVHEYGHAIQDNQVPGFGSTSQGGAMGEGFSDYLAASISEVFQPAGAFGACFAEWDSVGAGLAGDPPCLRRTDRDLTLAQAQAGQGCSDPGEFIYCGGEAWSGALWDIRTEVGAAVADRKVIESHDSLAADSDLHAGSVALVAAYAGDPSQSFVRTLLSQRGLYDTERLDDVPTAARSLGVPGSRGGFLQRGRDDDDLYKLRLTAGRGVVFRLRGSGHDFDLRLLRPGSGDDDLDNPSAVVDQAETAGSNEDLAHRPTSTGDYFLDVRAFQGQGNYSLAVLVDTDSDTRPDSEDNCPSALNPGQEDTDGDRLGDACDRFPEDRLNDSDRDGLGALEDNCPTSANRVQTDWDEDGRGDVCDTSSKVTVRRLRTRGRKMTLRATYRPTLLGARAVTLNVERRRCRRCRFAKVTTLRRGKDRGKGRVDFTVRLRRKFTYRFRARLKDRRFAARSAWARVRLR